VESKYKIVKSKISIIAHTILPESKYKGTTKMLRKREQVFRKLDNMRKGITIEQSNQNMNTVRSFIATTVKSIMGMMITNTKKWDLERIKHTQN
jgi:hypothetical protein